jgi:hypothetical protein
MLPLLCACNAGSSIDLKREGTKQDYGFQEDYESDGAVAAARVGYAPIPFAWSEPGS